MCVSGWGPEGLLAVRGGRRWREEQGHEALAVLGCKTVDPSVSPSLRAHLSLSGGGADHSALKMRAA